MTAPHHMSALDLAKKIKAREISSREVTQYFIDRIEQYDDKINAVIVRRFEEALKEADAFDKDPISGLFAGVPMTVKECFEIAGTGANVGMPEWADVISTQDAFIVKKLRDEGAIMLGKTNVPPMCADIQSYNEIYGVTNNPWDVTRTPGGSSGGSSAALAAGFTPLEYGSDIGGSIRIPAHFCGLFGHKSSFGIIPKRGQIPPAHGTLFRRELSVLGPLALHAADLGAATHATLGVLEPQAKAYHLTLPPARAKQIKGLRIGVWLEDDYCPVDKEIVSAMQKTVQELSDHGAIIKDIRPDFSLEEHHYIYNTLLGAVTSAGADEETLARHRALLEDKDKGADIAYTSLRQAELTLMRYGEWVQWVEKREQLAQKWVRYFEDVDILIAPVTPTPAIIHDHSPPHERQINVNGQAYSYWDNIIYAGLAVCCGLPATAIPLSEKWGVHSNGMPFSMQVIGAAYEDNTTLAIATLLEEMGYHATHAPAYR